MVEMRQDL